MYIYIYTILIAQINTVLNNQYRDDHCNNTHSYFQLKAEMSLKQLTAYNVQKAKEVARCRANKLLREAAVASGGLAADQQQPALQGEAGAPGLMAPCMPVAGEQQAAQQKKPLSADPANTTGSAGARSRSRSRSPLLFTSDEEEE